MHTEGHGGGHGEPVDLDTLSEMGYERRDIAFGSLTRWIVAFFGLGFLFFFVAFFIFRWIAPVQREIADSGIEPKTRRVPAAPNPLLQNNVETKIDIERMRQDELGLMTSYGWVDQRGGVVRLPIEHAKNLLIQRGVQPTGQSVAPPVRTSPADSPRALNGTVPADKAPGGANAGDTAPRTSIPTQAPTQDPARNGGVTNAPTGASASPANPAANPRPAGSPGAGRE